jgi:hypothetical protein
MEPDSFESITRLCRMTPKPESPYLSLFKEAVKKAGEFLLIPVVIEPDGTSPRRLTELGIRKRLIYFRDSAKIGLGDIDSVVLHTGFEACALTAYGKQLQEQKSF